VRAAGIEQSPGSFPDVRESEIHESRFDGVEASLHKAGPGRMQQPTHIRFFSPAGLPGHFRELRCGIRQLRNGRRPARAEVMTANQHDPQVLQAPEAALRHFPPAGPAMKRKFKGLLHETGDVRTIKGRARDHQIECGIIPEDLC
jgi:hypothetical protein